MGWPLVAAAALSSVGSSLVNGFMGQGRDAMQFRAQKALDAYNNKFNAQEAEKQRAAAAASQAQQERYNSEQAQVSRLKQAGLNPALLYGGTTSSAGIASMSSASASPQSFTPTGNQFDFSGVPQTLLNAELQGAQIENLKTNTQSQGEDVTSKATTNKYLDTKTNLENLKLIQELANLKTQNLLSEKELQWFDELKSNTIDKIRQDIETSKTQASLNDAKVVTEGTVQGLNEAKTETEGTVQNLNKEKRRTEKTVQDLNKEKVITEQTLQNLNTERVNTEQTTQLLQRANSAVANITEKELQRKYDLDKSETDMFSKFCDKLGISQGLRKGLLNVYGEFSRGLGKGLAEFFSGDNWLEYLQNKYRTDSWNKPQNGSDEKPSQDKLEKPTPQNDNNDVVGAVPSRQNYAKWLDKHGKNMTQETKNKYNYIIQYLRDKPERLDVFKKKLYKLENDSDIKQYIDSAYLYAQAGY